jgi:hypothetical protein
MDNLPRNLAALPMFTRSFASIGIPKNSSRSNPFSSDELKCHVPNHTRIPVPSLFIFANPHSLGTWVESSADTSVRSDAKAYSTTLGVMTERQEKSVESGVPAAHVITIPNGNHFVFLSNETECLRAVHAFLSKLSPPN